MAKLLEELIKEKIHIGLAADLISLTLLAGDASSRRYYRATLRGSAAPQSIIVMELPSGSSLPLSSDELVIFKEPLNELPFLSMHRFLTRVGVRVPRLYGQWVAEGILLLEDLGDISLWDRVQGVAPAEAMAWYQKAIDQLLLLQIRGTKARDDACIAFQQRFDLQLYMWEFDHFIEYGLLKRPDTQATIAATEELRKIFFDIARRLEKQPLYLNHRDYHSWNLMIVDDQVIVIDFQDALLAPSQYDLASLLNDRETDRVIQPELEDQLILCYLEKREDLGQPKASRDEFFEIYLLSAIQRDLKVVGRFYYLHLVKGKSGYLKFISPTVRRLKRNFARAPGLERIIPVLAEYYEEMR